MDRSAQVRTRDLKQTMDLLQGLECIMTSFHNEQRGRNEPDPLLEELVAIHGHGYNWEALRYKMVSARAGRTSLRRPSNFGLVCSRHTTRPTAEAGQRRK